MKQDPWIQIFINLPPSTRLHEQLLHHALTHFQNRLFKVCSLELEEVGEVFCIWMGPVQAPSVGHYYYLENWPLVNQLKRSISSGMSPEGKLQCERETKAFLIIYMIYLKARGWHRASSSRVISLLFSQLVTNFPLKRMSGWVEGQVKYNRS